MKVSDGTYDHFARLNEKELFRFRIGPGLNSFTKRERNILKNARTACEVDFGKVIFFGTILYGFKVQGWDISKVKLSKNNFDALLFGHVEAYTGISKAIQNLKECLRNGGLLMGIFIKNCGMV